MKKINSLPDIKKIISKINDEQELVFFSGVFDLFHFGHFIALKNASSLGDILIVQIDGNCLVKERKGYDRPYLDESDRALMISSLEFVDYVFVSNIPSEDEQTLQYITPDIFVRSVLPHESDERRRQREKSLLKKYPSMRIVWLDRTPEISTTRVLPVVLRHTRGKRPELVTL